MKQILTNRKKNFEQVEAIRKTQYATEQAMEAVILYLRSVEKPLSEKAHQIIDEVLEGYDCESPEGHIVAGGKQSAEPHEKGTGIIEKEVPIVIDIFPRSRISGYFADMSRTVCVGSPSVELQKMFDTVLAAQELAISIIKPGVKCRELQKIVEKFFVYKGYKTSGKGKEFAFAEGFVHSVGHGVGLNIHEAPRISKESANVLEEGDVITIEPALYYQGIGGVRLEDLLLVTATGYENLAKLPKSLEI